MAKIKTAKDAAQAGIKFAIGKGQRGGFSQAWRARKAARIAAQKGGVDVGKAGRMAFHRGLTFPKRMALYAGIPVGGMVAAGSLGGGLLGGGLYGGYGYGGYGYGAYPYLAGGYPGGYNQYHFGGYNNFHRFMANPYGL